jgi:hypothetical protein
MTRAVEGELHSSLKRSTTGTVKATGGVLHGWYVNTVPSAAVTLTDAGGALGAGVVIPTTAAAGTYVIGLDLQFGGALTATFAGTGDITFIFN